MIQKWAHNLFEEQASRGPRSVALIFDDREISYDELNKRSNRVAHHLQKLGVKPGALVGICVERGPDMVVGVLGILKAGGAYVPFERLYSGNA
ncbi:MAG: AMP-binding protein [Acidobacteriota bacterium]|nr:MAG: AMP-binding protein [Acidobacteriota bacterium]